MWRLLVIVLLVTSLAGCGRKNKSRANKEGDKPAPSGGATGGVSNLPQNIHGAVKRTVGLHDLDQLRKIIVAIELQNNRMPSKQEILDDLKTTDRKMAALIAEGAVVLTNTRSNRGVWAYTKDPQTPTGEHLVVTAASVERMNLSQLQQVLQP